MGISERQALDCLRSADLIGMGMEADAIRRQLHPEGVVTYVIDCVVTEGKGLFESIQSSGASSISLISTSRFSELEQTVATIRERLPTIRVAGPCGEAILQLADAAGLSANEAVARLRDVGISLFSGADLAIGGHSERIFELHRCAHRAGIPTSAGMVFGAGESLEQRVQHLFAIRALQEETGGFSAFTPRSFTAAAGSMEAPTAVEYMRTLAVSRMVLDNIENVESSCLLQGLKVVQMALRFGANDAGAIRPEVMSSFSEENLRRVIRDAGFKPVERDPLYSTMFLNN